MERSAFVSWAAEVGDWQIGVEGVDLVLLVMNDRGLQHLLSSKFELTGEGSVAAGRWAVMHRRNRLDTEY